MPGHDELALGRRAGEVEAVIGLDEGDDPRDDRGRGLQVVGPDALVAMPDDRTARAADGEVVKTAEDNAVAPAGVLVGIYNAVRPDEEDTVARVLGGYAGNVSADTLTVGCRRNVKPEMAELKGVRLALAKELEEGMRLNTSVVKQLTSTDDIYGEKKFCKPASFTPSHTLVLYTNHLPKVGATDEGTWRRLIVIPFNAVFEGGSDVKNYADYLFENAGPAVLSWIIEGAKRIIAKDFHLKNPKVVQDAIDDYRGQNDWMSDFLEECCEVGPTFMEKSGELYQEYRAYCLRMGEYTRSTTDFYGALAQRDFERKRMTSGVVVKGLRIKSEFAG